MNSKIQYPLMPETDNIGHICMEKMSELYGENLPDEIIDRAKMELDAIISNGYATVYITAKHLSDKAREYEKP